MDDRPNGTEHEPRPVLHRFAHRCALLAMTALVGIAGISNGTPAFAQSQAPCVNINNTTAYGWPIRLRLGTQPPQQMRIEAQTFGRLCLARTPNTDEIINVSVRSSWMAVGECNLRPGGQVTIERRPAQDGSEVTHVSCSPPR